MASPGGDDRSRARRDEAVIAVEPREPVGRVRVEKVERCLDRVTAGESDTPDLSDRSEAVTRDPVISWRRRIRVCAG